MPEQVEQDNKNNCGRFCCCEKPNLQCGHVISYNLCPNHSVHRDATEDHVSDEEAQAAVRQWKRTLDNEHITFILVSHGEYSDACQECGGWDQCCSLQVNSIQVAGDNSFAQMEVEDAIGQTFIIPLGSRSFVGLQTCDGCEGEEST